MSVHSRLGGVDRETLLRGWFLLFVWLWLNLARSGFAAPSVESRTLSLWCWLFGSAFTIALIHRRNRLAGIIGFSIIALLAVRVGSRCLDSWTSAFWLAKNPGIARSGFAYLRHVLPPVSHALWATCQALIPFAVLIRHYTTRHRLMLYGKADNIDAEQAPRRRSGSYYFVTTA